jgi:hypothetical protein
MIMLTGFEKDAAIILTTTAIILLVARVLAETGRSEQSNYVAKRIKIPSIVVGLVAVLALIILFLATPD